MFTEKIVDLFAEGGALATTIRDYRPRAGQQQLAQAVAQNLLRGGVLLAEAGTGTGKTFAYLLPALAWGKKTLISTASKNLQEQIYQQDAPRMQKVLRGGAKIALLKGRRNYLCQQRYEQFTEKEASSDEEALWRQALADFYLTSDDGDLATLEDVPENAPILPQITSTADNCLGRECAFFDECFVQKARQKAKDADVVIVNHHLLLADFTLKTEGFSEILPNIEAFVIDEAHHLPQMAIHFFGDRFSTRQLLSFIDDCKTALVTEAPDVLTARQMVDNLSYRNDDVFLTLPDGVDLIEAQELSQNAAFWQACQQLQIALADVEEQLAEHRDRGKLIANAEQRCARLKNTLGKFIATPAPAPHPTQKTIPQAMWLERNPPRHFSLTAVPVNASKQFSNWVNQSGASWAFLSATLAVGGTFDHFARELGLRNYRALLLPGAFDYPRQALLFHPTGLPNPNDADYTEHMIDAVLPILNRSRGRAFLLFTSYRALNAARLALADQPFQLFVQGDAPKGQLLKAFRRANNALLLATSSFWEGVDVRGDKLVCVVIDKLPFTVPSDPVTKARHQWLQQQGLSPFIHDSLPMAIITLKQGVGRLIRDVDDYGVLVIADPRLTGKHYGKDFLRSLPEMSKTRKIEVVDRFFTFHEGK